MGYTKRHRNFLFLLAGVFLFIVSCSIGIEKRRYNKGYHVSVTQKQSRKVTKSTPTSTSASRTYAGTDARNQTAAVDDGPSIKATSHHRTEEPASAKSTSFIVEKNPDSTYKRPFFHRLTNKRLR
jgi:hypothetical protein